MNLATLSTRYYEGISRLEGAVGEALNEIWFCDFLYSPSYDTDWPQFDLAKNCVAEADNIFWQLRVLWYEIAGAVATTSKLPVYCVMEIFKFSGPLPDCSDYNTLHEKLDAEFKALQQ